jgi:hypothetical protein
MQADPFEVDHNYLSNLVRHCGVRTVLRLLIDVCHANAEGTAGGPDDRWVAAAKVLAAATKKVEV